MSHFLKAKIAFIDIKFMLKTCLLATVLTTTQAKGSSEVHVHGLAELTLVMEGDILAIQFSSPAMNLVGFEYKATSAEDIAKIEKLSTVLNQHEKVFLFSGTHCKHLETHIDVSSLIDEHNKEHEEHHADEEHKMHTLNDNHSEVIADYQFKCENLADISTIAVALFRFFSGLEKIQTMWITQTKQGSATLNADHSTVIFR